MSRAATFDLLAKNSEMNDLGFTSDSLHHNYTLEERPNPTGPFALLQWGTQDPDPFNDPDEIVKSPERLSLWIHFPTELTEDVTEINHVLDKCDEIFRAARDISGVDGYTLSFVRITGRSGDGKDPGYDTITRNAGYEIYYR